MLTVKHIEACGLESIVQCAKVSFLPKYKPEDKSLGNDTQNALDQVVAWDTDRNVNEGNHRYTSGRIYVMNDAGATVAKYDLCYQDYDKYDPATN